MNPTVDSNDLPLVPGALYALINFAHPESDPLAWYAGSGIWFSDFTDKPVRYSFDVAVRQAGAFDADLALASREAFAQMGCEATA